jgi:hypothetical protein
LENPLSYTIVPNPFVTVVTPLAPVAVEVVTKEEPELLSMDTVTLSAAPAVEEARKTKVKKRKTEETVETSDDAELEKLIQENLT